MSTPLRFTGTPEHTEPADLSPEQASKALDLLRYGDELMVDVEATAYHDIPEVRAWLAAVETLLHSIDGD